MVHGGSVVRIMKSPFLLLFSIYLFTEAYARISSFNDLAESITQAINYKVNKEVLVSGC